jgi:probable rRNA maturation factor
VSNIPDNSQLDHPDASITTDPDIRVEILTDPQIGWPIQCHLIRAAILAAAKDQGFSNGNVGVRITNDETIHRLNQDHLGHDFPTDVISFDYGSEGQSIEGEMVVSAETAACRSADLGWPMEHELALYVVHGTLHIAGLDDLTDADRIHMREGEHRVMLALGIDEITRFGPASIEGADPDRVFSKVHPQEEQA